MPVDVVGRPSRGEGRVPGVEVAGVDEGEARWLGGRLEGFVRPVLRFRKDIGCLGEV